ncbi:proteinase inhibitor I4 serpin (macronuclear) [Tetrahymena thermophila SB210]|uniref:Proteinase inhibitor I4 serpin n=1 Tax=Tetrahymena thermophila (strain SB210) TaxID=312017 RepID=Q22M43_TETTS|nr:proteinase inhibitor I4 serpin [Tetrahymena thermophila SB210]EAR86316.1 proteinase inhibitor I4 serpin [Tetrahymena thermophila SB210]|eukprot:XP_977177.1 proteinase inhibitor I4 serpin [Tetrahymena thermophila SB210]
MESKKHSVSHFSINYLKKSGQNENFFFSPASIFLSLSMAACGSEQQTLKEFKDVLNYQNNIELGQLIHSLNSLLTSSSQEFSVLSANKIYTGVSGMTQNCKQFIENNLNGGFEQVNFKEAESVRVSINKWVSIQTSTKIDELLKKDMISAQTKMILINALYLKAEWLYQFEVAQDRKFYLQPGKEESIVFTKMMYKEAEYKYGKFDHFEYIQLPFKNEAYAMEILLPITNLNDLENSITDEQIIKAQRSSKKTDVRLLLPKFKMGGTSQSVVSILQQLGIQDAFTNQANFKQFSQTEELLISNVIHSANIEVNEKGTEAVAATVIMAKKQCISLKKYQEFFCNKPFIFTISHIPSNTILFLGRFCVPVKQE